MATIDLRDEGFDVRTGVYRWSWSAAVDRVVVRDAAGGAIAAFPLRPVIETAPRLQPAWRLPIATVDGSLVRVRYESDEGRRIDLALRFEECYAVLQRVTYHAAQPVDIVRITYLAEEREGITEAAALTDRCVVPGARQDPEQAIFRTEGCEDVRLSIGCFGMGAGTYHQQWALPHYAVAGYAGDGASPGALCAGLGDTPDGAATVRIDRGRWCYEIALRSDLWGHRSGAGPHAFDWPMLFAIGGDWYASFGAYFDALVREGLAPLKRGLHAPPAAAFLPQYDTWGDQGARRCFLERFTEEHLRTIYADFRASGLRSWLFVIDDKWEDAYGTLRHDAGRFPHFPAFLDSVRADGIEIGLWTAFPRCEDYEALGLDASCVLVTPDGAPYVERQRKRSWYVFDPTEPRVEALLRQRARAFIETYRPKLVKIDFGYEIPLPNVAGPHDPRQGGERLFRLFIEIICGEIKATDPSLAILYYCLTPLFNAYIDQCGADDLWMSRGRYDAGFARRALLSALCGRTGLVPYGSSGYDWRSAASIWLDTAVIGTLGVIAPLAGDEYGERLTPGLAARYNGIARITRTNPVFDVRFLDAELRDADAGPVARSWERIEDGETVVVALRPGGASVLPSIVSSDCAMVVASLTARGIAGSSELAVVPFEDGEVRIAREGGSGARATARAHRLDGTGEPWDAVWTGDVLRVPVSASAADGSPIEHIQITFE